MTDKRTKADLRECISYLDRKISTLSNQNSDYDTKITVLASRLNQSTEVSSKLEKEVIRNNELISALIQENNRLTIERNAANALCDRIRLPSEMNISARDMQKLMDNLSAEIVAALLLVKG